MHFSAWWSPWPHSPQRISAQPPKPQLRQHRQWPTCYPSQQTNICPHFPRSALCREAIQLPLRKNEILWCLKETLQELLVTCWSSNKNYCVSYWHNPFLCLKIHCLVKTQGWERALTPLVSIFGLCCSSQSINKLLMCVYLEKTPSPFIHHRQIQKCALANHLEYINPHINILCSRTNFLSPSRSARKLNWKILGSQHAQFVLITKHKRAGPSAEHRLEPTESSHPQSPAAPLTRWYS